MSARLRRVGRLARKRPRAGGLDGPAQARLSCVLAAAGVPTPPMRWDARAHELELAWLDGIDGRAWLRAALTAGDAAWPEIADTVVAPLVALHAVAPTALALPELDPWRRVRPRLARLAPERRARIEPLVRRLEASLGTTADVPVPVHGDFHLGQVLIASDTGRPWLLDLEDAALGPLESDLANCAAHLATRDDLHPGEAARVAIHARYEAALDLLVAAYRRHGGRAPRPSSLAGHGALALLRRGLKLDEHGGQPDRLAEVVDAATSVAGATP
ncbi:MAG: phosphotransferase [Ectothiorhodospiraceae bacterium]|nr:phosphotransferase [Chromatiales bacterium]MCP5153691.1 phosphotransferase [Ectothiorhodospiraceae bacterium]